jgi:hypothetical protein
MGTATANQIGPLSAIGLPPLDADVARCASTYRAPIGDAH